MNLTLHVWRQSDAADKGRFVTYQAEGISADMSFLEMLDVVNERLIDGGETADRVRSRLPRGDLRHLRDGDQRQPARAATADDHLPAPHALVFRTATRSRSSRGARRRFPCCATSSSIGAPSTGSSRPAASSRSGREALPTATRS